MAKINILDKHVAELIAAGEVVERPASAIKELVENAIDAGATAITVEIKHGGIQYMRITDNGSGIAREDVPKAFLRHATSKVQKEDDLDSIDTLGFRGEALASVCAVSKVELLTRTQDESIGTRYTIEGGEELELEDAGCPQGTTIVLRELFYNIPARMKFLKRDISEANAVAGVMDKIALSHPEIAFTFIRDGKQTLKTAGDNQLKSAIYSVYGREFAQGLIEVNYSLNGVTVTGFVSKPQNSRANRNMQNFFINGRFVKSRTAMAAVEEACKGKVMAGKFPACILQLSMAFSAVDVNVHPAKIEVRFVNERPIFDAVYHGVKTALLKSDTVKEISLDPKKIIKHKEVNPFHTDTNPYALKKEAPIQLSLKGNTPIKEFEGIILAKDYSKTEKSKLPVEPELFIPKASKYKQNVKVSDRNETHVNTDTEVIPASAFTINNLDLLKPSADKEEEASVPAAKEAAVIKDSLPVEKEKEEPQQQTEKTPNILAEEPEIGFTILGEAFSTYIVVQRGEDQLVLVDKHAAHERIIYEKLKKEKGAGSMQYLLTPVSITLSKLEYDVLLNSKEMLLDIGFEIDDFGNGTILVRGIPQYIDQTDISAVIEEVAEHLSSHKTDVSTAQMDWIYHSVACRAAIKAGNINQTEELFELVNRIEHDDSIRYCPHGRPVSIVLTKKEIEKQFGRV